MVSQSSLKFWPIPYFRRFGWISLGWHLCQFLGTNRNGSGVVSFSDFSVNLSICFTSCLDTKSLYGLVSYLFVGVGAIRFLNKVIFNSQIRPTVTNIFNETFTVSIGSRTQYINGSVELFLS